MGAKTDVKLAYKHDVAPIFTSDGHPMLLVRPWPGKKMCRPELLHFSLAFFPLVCYIVKGIIPKSTDNEERYRYGRSKEFGR